jgi:esterase/lipase superfamily enzyme
MRREKYTLQSTILEKDVKVYVYGHFGISVLLFPSLDDNPLEYEEIGLIRSLSPLIENGHIKVFSIETYNNHSWQNQDLTSKEKSDNHFKFNRFLTNELVQFIYNDNGTAIPIITSGGGIGAFHAVNSYLRRPDIFMGSIGANGFYDIQWLSGAYYDENCYFNSPIQYLPNLTDDYWLSFLKSQNHLYLVAEDNNWDMINQARSLAEILVYKQIPHKLEIVNIENKSDNIIKTMLNNILKFNY